MKWVQVPAIRPHRCAVIPFIGSHNSRAGFIDTGQDMRDADSHVYISVQAVEQMAQFIGWEPATQRAAVELKVKTRDEQIAALRAEIVEHERRYEAAEYTLKASFGEDTKVRSKPGRKPKVAA